MDNRDRFEEIFREKLQDWDVQPAPELWDKISGQLPVRKSGMFLISLRRIAALSALFLLIGGGLLWQHRKQNGDHLQITAGVATPVRTQGQIQPAQPPVATPVLSVPSPGNIQVLLSGIPDIRILRDTLYPILSLNQTIKLTNPIPVTLATISLPQRIRITNLRKWHFGMGGGNFNIAGISTTPSGYPDYVYNSDFQTPHPEEPNTKTGSGETRGKSLNTLLSELNPSKVKRSSPVSVGISVSRSLSERWSFSTGLSYSYLRIQWRYDDSRYDLLRQKAHMLGIPVSFNYRFGDWKRPYWYLSMGLLCEVNVANKIYTARQSQYKRIPGTLWTANSRIGLAYPIIRYVSAYAEGGILYNFTPSGEIRLLRSDKRFNLTGQVGLRLNF